MQIAGNPWLRRSVPYSPRFAHLAVTSRSVCYLGNTQAWRHGYPRPSSCVLVSPSHQHPSLNQFRYRSHEHQYLLFPTPHHLRSMSYTQNDPDAVIPTRHFCDDCKQTTASKLDCANLEKVVCFTCPRRDHFSGDCHNLIRKSNPPSSVPAFWSSLPLRRLFPTISTRSSTTGLRTQSTDVANPTPCEREEYTERKDVEIQLLDWQHRCNDALRLLRACDREDAADALELQRPDLRGWKEPSGKEYTHVHEYEKVANIFGDQVLVTRNSSRRLTRRKQQLNAMKKYCLAIFHKLEAFGLAEAGKTPCT